ncbi:hypothetical protein PIB30_102428 [Stylosanthes scabra]|uniref:Uncharacterized protein n=1 Tax=Stylosanthes scabra TaxID=79078 RepID=A0ABU6UXZ2_9FABA|nr:hypothetical protein [Stylosanthes scabra]
MLPVATIVRSIDPKLSVAEETNRWVTQLTRNLKSLSLQKGKLKLLKEEKEAEVERLKVENAGLSSEVDRLRGLLVVEMVRSYLAEAFIGDLGEQCEELAKDAKGSMFATKGALKAQLAILVPNFDTA